MNVSRLFSFQKRLLLFSPSGFEASTLRWTPPSLALGTAEWSVWMDSNHRPHAYQACALTTWATNRYSHSFGIGSDIIGDDGVLNQNLHSVQIRKTLFCFHGFSLPCFSIFKTQGVPHLRFWKWWRWWGSNPWPPACRAGALPAELHPRFRVAFAFSKTSKLSLVWSLKIEQQKVHTHILSETSLVIRRLRQLREKLSWSP